MYVCVCGGVNNLYCGNHFAINVCQIIMLYTLNLHMLHTNNLSKSRRKKNIPHIQLHLSSCFKKLQFQKERNGKWYFQSS